MVVYLSECLFFVLTSPLHLRNFVIRSREGRYRGVFWLRFFGLTPGKRGVITFIASGMGETMQSTVYAPRVPGETQILSQLSRTFAHLDDLPQDIKCAPFKWPLGAIILLLRLRPSRLVFVGNVSDIHLAFWGRLLGIPIILIHTSLDEYDVVRREKRARSRLRFHLLDKALVRCEDQIALLARFGVPSEWIQIIGPQLRMGIKVDREAIQDKWRRTLALSATDQVIVAGSTWGNDEEVVIDAILRLWDTDPAVKLILAPRRLDREVNATETLSRLGIPFALRSTGVASSDRLIVLNTMGELAEVYSVASAVFVGGTFSHAIGGHSFSEAIEWDVWFTSGPDTSHQTAIVTELQTRGLLTVCRGADSLSSAWKRQLEHPPEIDLVDRSIEKIVAAITG
ncbi:MAG: hypothetical protein JNK63_07600 [Chthonomonas sp.]|nr:hypothetical protein [Chthonomonas sp.]